MEKYEEAKTEAQSVVPPTTPSTFISDDEVAEETDVMRETPYATQYTVISDDEHDPAFRDTGIMRETFASLISADNEAAAEMRVKQVGAFRDPSVRLEDAHTLNPMVHNSYSCTSWDHGASTEVDPYTREELIWGPVSKRPLPLRDVSAGELEAQRDYIHPRSPNSFLVHDPVQGSKRMHFRVFLPKERTNSYATSPPLEERFSGGVLLWFHGYSGHINSAYHHRLYRQLSESTKSIVICADRLGHGYSEGVRALLTDLQADTHAYLDFVNTLLVASYEERAREDGSTAPLTFEDREETLELIRRRWAQEGCALRFIGESLGGCSSIIAALAMQGSALNPEADATTLRSWPDLAPRFRGCIPIAPFCEAKMPSPMLLWVMRHIVVPLIPQHQIPEALRKREGLEVAYRDRALMKLVENDAWAKGGLGYGAAMRFQTADAFVAAAESMRHPECFTRLTCDMLIIADLEDAIVSHVGIERLAEATKETSRLVVVPNGLHCVSINETDLVCRTIVQWMEDMDRKR